MISLVMKRTPIILITTFFVSGCGDNAGTGSKYEPPTKEALLTESCNFTSIDEGKTIEFHLGTKPDNSRTFMIKERFEKDNDDPLWELKRYRERHGTWSVDEKSGIVTIRLGETMVTYRFLDPGGICILASGSDLTMVNLATSWVGDETNPLEDNER